MSAKQRGDGISKMTAYEIRCAFTPDRDMSDCAISANAIGEGLTKAAFVAGVRAEGWETVAGLWICPKCLRREAARAGMEVRQ